MNTWGFIFTLLLALVSAQQVQYMNYVLQFYESATPTSSGFNVIGYSSSQLFETIVQPGFGVMTDITPVPGPKAIFHSLVKNLSNSTFLESGNITFPSHHGQIENAIFFETLGEGSQVSYPQENLSHGTVVWEITSGSGVFAGASGKITSNFIVNETDGTAIDNHFGIIWLPVN